MTRLQSGAQVRCSSLRFAAKAELSFVLYDLHNVSAFLHTQHVFLLLYG